VWSSGYVVCEGYDGSRGVGDGGLDLARSDLLISSSLATKSSAYHILQFRNHLFSGLWTRCSQFCYELINRQTRVNRLRLQDLPLQHGSNNLLYQPQITVLRVSFRPGSAPTEFSPSQTHSCHLPQLSRRCPNPSPRTLWRS
jgi:hypothetical protein